MYSSWPAAISMPGRSTPSSLPTPCAVRGTQQPSRMAPDAMSWWPSPRCQELKKSATYARGAGDPRRAGTRHFAAAPSAVVFIERGTLPKTPSGKVRRNHLRALWTEGKLIELASG